jgi:hypothetical protein
MEQWTPELQASIAEALAASANVSTSSVALVDVRPVSAEAAAAAAAAPSSSAGRRLMQEAAAPPAAPAAEPKPVKNGIQATFFVKTPDPDALNKRMQVAAGDGTLSKGLTAKGVPYQPDVAVQTYYREWLAVYDAYISYDSGGWMLMVALLMGELSCRCTRALISLPPPCPVSSPPHAAPPRRAHFPLWALAPLIIGILLLLALAALGVIWYRNRRSGNQKPLQTKELALPKTDKPAAAAAAAAPAPAAPTGGDKASSGGGGKASSGGGAAAAAAKPAATADAALDANEEKLYGASNIPLRKLAGATKAAKARAEAAAKAEADAEAAAAAAAASGSGLKVNVRSPGAALTSLTSSTKANQGDRARFWAQFQETWQQVRESKRLKETQEPGTPSSGTAWTETTASETSEKRPPPPGKKK